MEYGKVKWFDVEKGFGFIEPENGSKDVFMHRNNIENLGFNEGINDGESVEFKIEETSDTPYIVVDNTGELTYKELKDRLQPTFNYEKLKGLVRVITRNLNKIIDKNFYPLQQNKLSNLSHRPIGIGVQGLADVFIMMGFSFDSEEAKELNARIFEKIYYSSKVSYLHSATNQIVYLLSLDDLLLHQSCC